METPEQREERIRRLRDEMIAKAQIRELRKRRQQKELEKVKETRPTSLKQPVLNTREQIDAYSLATEAEIARLEYEQAKEGKIPISYYARKALYVIGGLGVVAGLLTYIKGC